MHDAARSAQLGLVDELEQVFAVELELLLRVPYPLVFIQCFEEKWVFELLVQLAQLQRQHVFSWSRVRGVYSPSAASIANGHDLLSLGHALDAFRRIEAPALFLMLDPAGELGEIEVRQLRELADVFPGRRQTLLVLSPFVEVPQHLGHDSTKLSAPLPSRKRLERVLQLSLPPERFGLLPRERMVAAALGLTRAQAHRAFLRARLAFESTSPDPSFDWERIVIEEKRRAISSNDVVEFVDTEENLNTVGGLDELKDWLETRKAAFTEEARAFGLPVPRGLLLVGVQGCGKSLLAKAIAKHWGLPLLRLDLGGIFAGKYAPDAALNRALRIAETLSPCILWTDEIEKAFGNDGGGIATRILGTLLTWLQEKRSEVFYVATANEVTEIPPELLRKGRFDELFFVDLPDRESRAQIFSIHLRKRKRRPADFDLAELSAKTEHHSGAEIEQLVIAALYEAFAEARELSMRDLLAVIDESVPLYATREEAIKALREWASSRTRFAAKDLRLTSFFED